MEEKENFGKFLMKKRKEKGLTQKELADRLYITESEISKWERGLSYPDITLIAGICSELEISEHELITASEDNKQRTMEREADNYHKLKLTYKLIWISIYGIAILTCFICNIAVQHTLSWFFIVLTSIMLAFSLTTLPVFFENHKALKTLIAFYGSLVLLLISCRIVIGGNNWLIMTLISVTFGLSVVFLPLVLKSLLHGYFC